MQARKITRRSVLRYFTETKDVVSVNIETWRAEFCDQQVIEYYISQNRGAILGLFDNASRTAVGNSVRTFFIITDKYMAMSLWVWHRLADFCLTILVVPHGQRIAISQYKCLNRGCRMASFIARRR